MKEEELLKVGIPEATVKIRDGKVEGKVRFELAKEEDLWYLEGKLSWKGKEETDRELLEAEDMADILEDVLSVDQYFQDEPFREHVERLSKRLLMRMEGSLREEDVEVRIGPYLPQASSAGENLLEILAEHVRKKMRKVPIPPHLRVDPPENFVPDEVVLESLRQRIYEGVPVIALLGPTGSGKSAMARFVAHALNRRGFGAYIIDANARLESDRLFDRDDFDQRGTFILEGVLCRLARETKRMGIRLLVILEEYNAFSDETRREFYRLFSDEGRSYRIQSTKHGKLLDVVDFSHVQFLLTANPLSSESYITEDLKRLSNAETRRMVLIYLDYTRNRKRIRKILRAIIGKKPSFRELKDLVPDLEERIPWDVGVEAFLALNRRDEPLGYDVGYSSVADAIWTATLRGHRRDALAIAFCEHILNGIPDRERRQLAAERIRQATGVQVPQDLIWR